MGRFSSSACVHAGALDVDADEVYFGEKLGQSYRIFTFAAAQLQDDGVGIVEILLTPFAFHLKRHVVDDRERILEDIAEGLHLGEFL